VIYTIQNKITPDELYRLIVSNNIDYFCIDTTNFLNVKEYREIIKEIKKICEEEKKLIGIIVKLRGRKIQVVNLKNVIEYKAGDVLYISYNPKKQSDKNTLIVNSKDLHKMLRKGDHIIVNDNLGAFRVTGVNEEEVHCRKSLKLIPSDNDLHTSGHRLSLNTNMYLEQLNALSNSKMNSPRSPCGSPRSPTKKYELNYNDIYGNIEMESNIQFEPMEDDMSSYTNTRDEFIKKFSNEYEKLKKEREEQLMQRKRKLQSSKTSLAKIEIKVEVVHDFKLTENAFLFVPSKNSFNIFRC
jgi:chemotaxis signal transduction protein